MQKTILITGWLGYIGSHGVVAFEEAWYKCVIVDNLSNTEISVLDNIEKVLGYKVDFFEIDLRDKQSLREIFEQYDFDGVLHFAWLKAVWESCEKPFLYYENNILWSINLFELMNEFGVKKIIFSSSATVYKPLWNRAILETDEVWECSNPYGTTKFIVENILNDLSKTSDFNVINLRYFNPIWAHPSGHIWENPRWIPNNLVPYIMKVATGELPELSVFWDDYDTIDGTWVRDYIDVCDLIDGHVKAYEYLEERYNVKDGIFEIFNLGIGKWVSVLEMVNAVEKVVWEKILYSIKPRREWDISMSFCDPSKAKKVLNWEVKVSLEESLERSFRFYKK